MAFEHYVVRGTARLRCGYTTGSCAALAAKAAVMLLLTGNAPETVSLIAPKGISVEADVLDACFLGKAAICAVKKDAGDDCDVTDQMKISARVEKTEQGIEIKGGEGIGIVTKSGLDQPVGEYAINSVPRSMIAHEVGAAAKQCGYNGGISVSIAAPDGLRAAEKTFNSQLGIKGGISILGTSGIVEPQSVSALIESIGLEIKMHAVSGEKKLILAPGNFAEHYLSEVLKIEGVPCVKCSNYIGASLDFAAVNGFSEVLLISHIGKAVKLAGSIMDTHSKTADCRVEIITAHAACCQISAAIAQSLMKCATTEACFEILADVGLEKEVSCRILTALQERLERRAAGAFSVGAAVFKNDYVPLGITERGQRMIEGWRNKN